MNKQRKWHYAVFRDSGNAEGGLTFVVCGIVWAVYSLDAATEVLKMHDLYKADDVLLIDDETDGREEFVVGVTIDGLLCMDKVIGGL